MLRYIESYPHIQTHTHTHMYTYNGICVWKEKGAREREGERASEEWIAKTEGYIENLKLWGLGACWSQRVVLRWVGWTEESADGLNDILALPSFRRYLPSHRCLVYVFLIVYTRRRGERMRNTWKERMSERKGLSQSRVGECAAKYLRIVTIATPLTPARNHRFLLCHHLRELDGERTRATPRSMPVYLHPSQSPTILLSLFSLPASLRCPRPVHRTGHTTINRPATPQPLAPSFDGSSCCWNGLMLLIHVPALSPLTL